MAPAVGAQDRRWVIWSSKTTISNCDFHRGFVRLSAEWSPYANHTSSYITYILQEYIFLLFYHRWYSTPSFLSRIISHTPRLLQNGNISGISYLVLECNLCWRSFLVLLKYWWMLYGCRNIYNWQIYSLTFSILEVTIVNNTYDIPFLNVGFFCC